MPAPSVRFGGIELDEERDFRGSDVSDDVAAKWPYLIGLISIVVGAAGFVFAPISGIVYVSLPGVAFATFHAFMSRSPARLPSAVSATVLTFGLVTGAVALYAFTGDNFFLQEWASMLALFGMPILGIALGVPAMVFAWFRPGRRPCRLPPIGEIS
jgi:hypothetical protein